MRAVMTLAALALLGAAYLAQAEEPAGGPGKAPALQNASADEKVKYQKLVEEAIERKRSSIEPCVTQFVTSRGKTTASVTVTITIGVEGNLTQHISAATEEDPVRFQGCVEQRIGSISVPGVPQGVQINITRTLSWKLEKKAEEPKKGGAPPKK